MDAGHAGPREGIHVEELAEKLGHVPELVGLQSVHCGVLVEEGFVEHSHPGLVE